ncbi:hypothetical protein CI238_05826, partial [Colletotrichum incanum]
LASSSPPPSTRRRSTGTSPSWPPSASRSSSSPTSTPAASALSAPTSGSPAITSRRPTSRSTWASRRRTAKQSTSSTRLPSPPGPRTTAPLGCGRTTTPTTTVPLSLTPRGTTSRWSATCQRLRSKEWNCAALVCFYLVMRHQVQMVRETGVIGVETSREARVDGALYESIHDDRKGLFQSLYKEVKTSAVKTIEETIKHDKRR